MRYYYNRWYSSSPFNFFRISTESAVNLLLIFNFLLYFLQLVSGDVFVYIFGLVPYDVIHKLHLWQLITYMFLHGGFFHLFFNMYVLLLFGKPLEETWGRGEFLKYYFITGVGAAALNILFTPNSKIPVIGASGAIYGLIIGYAMMFPYSIILLFFFFPLPARQAVLLLGIIEFLSGVSGSRIGIAHFAHLGGLLTGYVYIKYFQYRSFYRFSFLQPLFRTFSRVIHKIAALKAKKMRHSREEIDRILTKILMYGPQSLTEDEQKTIDLYLRTKH
jgi:membrane associated rhomboid family serine protease